MILQVRTARPSIVMNGADYFQKLAPYFLNLAYTDSCDGQKADDLQLQLADRDGRFVSDWMPDKGAFLDIGIIAERWFAPNAAPITMPCGRFWIDEVECELPQHTVSIKGSSIPTDGHIKAADETRGWENKTLRVIAEQIAKENKLDGVEWRSDYNPEYSYVEQTEQSGLEFLMHKARDAKLAIKVHLKKIIFFDEEQLESAPPAFAIVFGEGMPGGALQALGALAPLVSGASLPTGGNVYRMVGGKFTSKLVDTAKKATVTHLDLANGKTTQGEHTDNDPDGKAITDWHTNIPQSTDCKDEEDDGEGEDGDGELRTEPISQWQKPGPSASDTRLAKSKLRGKNKDRFHAEIQMSIGNPLVVAGQVFLLQGVGKYDGNWFVESATHKVGPVYTTTLQARKCLTGF